MESEIYKNNVKTQLSEASFKTFLRGRHPDRNPKKEFYVTHW